MMFPKRSLFFIELIIMLLCTSFADAQESPYIVGGVNAKYGEVPYQVSLQKNNKHKCGGSIISNCWVITTAYCVFVLLGSNITSLSVLAGTTNLNSGGVRVAVEKTIPHEHFKNHFQNNIALIKLNTCLTYNKTMQPVKLEKSHIRPGTLGIASGWGDIDGDYGGPLVEVANNTQIGMIVENNLCALGRPDAYTRVAPFYKWIQDNAK